MSKLTERILFLKFVKIREFPEFLEFIKFEFLIYAVDWSNKLSVYKMKIIVKETVY